MSPGAVAVTSSSAAAATASANNKPSSSTTEENEAKQLLSLRWHSAKYSLLRQQSSSTTTTTTFLASVIGRHVYVLFPSRRVCYAMVFASCKSARTFCFDLLARPSAIQAQAAAASSSSTTGGPRDLRAVYLVSAEPDLVSRVASQVFPSQTKKMTRAVRLLQARFRFVKHLVAQVHAGAARRIQVWFRRVRLVRAQRKLFVLQEEHRLALASKLACLSREMVEFCACAHNTVCRQFGLVTLLVDLIRSNCFLVRSDMQLDMYGSMATGLALPSSDVDLVCNASLSELELISRNLNASLGSAKLVGGHPPVIKLVAMVNGVPMRVDLSTASNTHTGLQSALLVRAALALDPRIEPVVLVVKQLLFERNLGVVYTGGLSSHAVFVLVASIAKQVPRTATCAEILLLALHTYGEDGFFQKCYVSATGGAGLLSALEERQPDFMPPCVIEDPVREGNNLGAGSFRIAEVQKAFKAGAKALESGGGLRALVQRATWWK
jgi:hypothetical protein